jgi:predicted negative regulator of RcsB-dependent stress response
LALIEEVESNNSNVSFVEDLMAMKASILVAQSKHEKAIEAFKALEDKASNSDNRLIARLGVMRSAVKIDNYAVMEAYADKLLNGSGLSAAEEKEAAFCRAYARYQQGNSEVASKEFAELAKNGNSIYGAQASFYLAELQFGENRLNEAENTLNTFIDSGTEHNYWLARAFILLADIYHKQGKTFEAREYLESLKGSYPGEADGIMEMIDSRLKKWSSTKTKKK